MNELRSTIEHVTIAEDAIKESLSLLSSWTQRYPFYITEEQREFLTDEISRATKALIDAKIAFNREAKGNEKQLA